MQLESERVKVPLTTAGPGQSHAGDQENAILTTQKVTDWLIIYSCFTSNLVLPEEFLYKFELVKGLRFVIF